MHQDSLEPAAIRFTLEVLSKQPTFAVHVWRDLHAEFPVTLEHNFFCEGLQFFFVATQKKGLHYISLASSRNESQ